MKKVLPISLVGLAMLVGVSPVHAKECAGTTFPDQVQSEVGTLALNGLGLRQATMFKVDVYVAGLYLMQVSGDANAILESNTAKELVLRFVRDVGSDDLNKAWDEGFQNNAKDQLSSLQDRIETFKSWMTDVNSGQEIRFVLTPGSGTQVAMDDTLKGTIEGDDFARALLAIWLGPKPPNADLKTGLLGGACG
jgi:hypothetical protein